MSKKRYKPEEIVNLLRKIEVEIANGKKSAQAAPEVGPVNRPAPSAKSQS